MNLEERVINEFVRRIKSGQNIGQAVSFCPKDDFPDVSDEELSEYRSRWYVNKYYYGNFALKRNYAESILEEYGLL